MHGRDIPARERVVRIEQRVGCLAFLSTYTAVVNNLDNGGELASEGAAADQDKAANLDQLPGSELNVDIGHREFLEVTRKKSQRSFSFYSVELFAAAALTVDRVGMCRRVVVERVGLSKFTLANFGCAHTILA
jgi:hypothetical protein